MAEGLIRYAVSPHANRFVPPEPGAPEYELWLDGREPDVQLIGAAEMKVAPNYSDWLRARSQPKEA